MTTKGKVVKDTPMIVRHHPTEAPDRLRVERHRPGPVVRVRGLTKVFGERTVVEALDLDVEPGESLGLLGPNGAGKSSTMRMVGCVSPPTSGSVSVFGLDACRNGARIRARIGVVPQRDNLDEQLTVRENLVVYARYFGVGRAEARRRADELLAFAQLSERADAAVEPLSGGMKRRLTIARSLVNNPELLLLDEPTTGLDPQARHHVWERLFRLRSLGVTFLLTTHDMHEAEQLCDRIVILDAGRIVALDTPARLLALHTTREVVELRLAPDQRAEQLARLQGVAHRIESLPDRVILYVDDAESAIEAVHTRGIRPLTVLARRGTLEDVFFRLTGRSLTAEEGALPGDAPVEGAEEETRIAVTEGSAG